MHFLEAYEFSDNKDEPLGAELWPRDVMTEGNAVKETCFQVS
jgi:hypothetical protein